MVLGSKRRVRADEVLPLPPTCQGTLRKSLAVSDLGFWPIENNRQCSKVVRQAGCPGVPGPSAPAGWPHALGQLTLSGLTFLSCVTDTGAALPLRAAWRVTSGNAHKGRWVRGS